MAVPALAVLSSVAGAVTGAVGVVMRDMSPLLVGAPRTADQPGASDRAPPSGKVAPGATLDTALPPAATMSGSAQDRCTGAPFLAWLLTISHHLAVSKRRQAREVTTPAVETPAVDVRVDPEAVALGRLAEDNCA